MMSIVAWTFHRGSALNALAQVIIVVCLVQPFFIGRILPCHSVSYFLSDERVIAKQKCLHAEARKAKEAITQKAAEMATLAARTACLQRQLDFLDRHEDTILHSELECLELLERAEVQVPGPD